jgi:hypothetical protein
VYIENKRMKKILLATIFLCTGLSSFSQTNCSIKKAFAFYTVTVAGIAMSDENGNTINPEPFINRFIYIVCSGTKKPKIVQVTYDKKPYSIIVSSVSGSSVIPGDDIGNNKEHKISTKKNNRIWKIEIQSSADNKIAVQDCKNIIIKLKGTDKTCTFKLLKETQLMTLPRY